MVLEDFLGKVLEVLSHGDQAVKDVVSKTTDLGSNLPDWLVSMSSLNLRYELL